MTTTRDRSSRRWLWQEYDVRSPDGKPLRGRIDDAHLTDVFPGLQLAERHAEAADGRRRLASDHRPVRRHHHGVPVGFEIAQVLKAPLDVLVVRKIGAPHHPEYGIGAITEEGFYWLDPDTLHALNLSESDLETHIQRESEEVNRRIESFRENRAFGCHLIAVADGIQPKKS